MNPWGEAAIHLVEMIWRIELIERGNGFHSGSIIPSKRIPIPKRIIDLLLLDVLNKFNKHQKKDFFWLWNILIQQERTINHKSFIASLHFLRLHINQNCLHWNFQDFIVPIRKNQKRRFSQIKENHIKDKVRLIVVVKKELLSHPRHKKIKPQLKSRQVSKL